MKYYADKQTAEEAAKQNGGRVVPYRIIHDDGTPYLDCGNEIIVYGVTLVK